MLGEGDFERESGSRRLKSRAKHYWVEGRAEIRRPPPGPPGLPLPRWGEGGMEGSAVGARAGAGRLPLLVGFRPGDGLIPARVRGGGSGLEEGGG